MDAAVRQQVRERAAGKCEYCRLPDFITHQGFHVDHLIPRFHGGPDDPENLAFACPRCNHRKGTNLAGLDPDTGEVAPLFNPRTDVWTEHFAPRGARILGMTAQGRATAWVLDLNANDRLKAREFLLRAGAWP